MTRFNLPRRTEDDLTAEEIAADEAEHDAAMERLINAITGTTTDVETP